MRKLTNRATWTRLLLLAGGSLFFLNGCDPTLRATVEDGIINSSASLVGALVRALIELGSEAQTTTTAQLFIDTAQKALA
jgi:hypothetical protein